MINIKLTGATYEIDMKAYEKALRKAIEEEVGKAAQKFAATALSKIPIRTGFVAGSFGELTELLGANAKFNPIVSFISGIIKKTKKLVGIKQKVVTARAANNQIEYYYPGDGTRVLNTTMSGRQFATKKSEILSWRGNKYTFHFEVDISYFRISDNFRSWSPTSPWQAFKSAELAFEEHMKSIEGRQLITIENFVTVKKI